MRTLILLLVTVSFIARAQYPYDIKSDNSWVIGYGPSPRPWGMSLMKFNGASFDTIYFDNLLGKEVHDTNSSISDSSGDLLFYTNGYEIIGSNHQTIANGDSINCCDVFYEAYHNYGQLLIQNVIVLPFINTVNEHLSKYYVLHRPYVFLINTIIHPEARYSIVGYENDTLKTIKKNITFVSDSLNWAELTACRHANGRDWWVLQNETQSKNFYTTLITPDSIINFGKQTVNKKVPQRIGQSMFSPDGTKYIIAALDNVEGTYKHYISIYNFDRCTGLLSGQKFFTFIDSTYSVSAGAAVSPNSRYLYFALRTKIWQFDLNAPDILASKTTVAEYDGFVDTITGTPWGTTFVWMQLGPDNKIYICAGNTTYLHTIDNPDEQGLACNVNQHSFRLPTKNAYSMPNFPNFRLGPIDGSACDTLGIDNLTNINDKLDNNTEPVKIYPNPATDYITLFVPRITKQWQFALYDITGKEVFKNQSRGAFRSYNINHLAQGMYLWKLVYEDGKVENGKIVKQ